jgi:hypothetical protein
MRLSEDESIALDEVMSSEYWPAIIKALEMGIELHKERLMSSDITLDDRAIVLAKARLDGAQALAAFMASIKRKKEKKNAAK